MSAELKKAYSSWKCLILFPVATEAEGSRPAYRALLPILFLLPVNMKVHPSLE